MAATWRKVRKERHQTREYVCWKEHGKHRQRLAHRWVWEQANGPIPTGYDVHHKDHDSLNNDLSNLELIERRRHKRLHGAIRSAEVERNGQRKCSRCGKWKPVSEYAKRTGRIRQAICKLCSREYLREWRAKNREHANAYQRAYYKRKRATLQISK